MNDYLQRLVRPAEPAVRVGVPAPQEVDVGGAAAESSDGLARGAVAATSPTQAVTSMDYVTRWLSGHGSQSVPEAGARPAISARPAQRQAPAKTSPEGLADGPHGLRRAAAAPVDPVVPTPPAAGSDGTTSRQFAVPRQRDPQRLAASTTRAMGPDARPAPRAAAKEARGQVVEVHVGAIALTVIAPAAAPAAVAVTAAAPTPAAANGAQRPAAAASDGLRFSASRHYLRWS